MPLRSNENSVHVIYPTIKHYSFKVNKSLMIIIYTDMNDYCKIINIYLLLIEFEGRTVSYGPSFFDLWPKREACGP